MLPEAEVGPDVDAIAWRYLKRDAVSLIDAARNLVGHAAVEIAGLGPCRCRRDAERPALYRCGVCYGSELLRDAQRRLDDLRRRLETVEHDRLGRRATVCYDCGSVCECGPCRRQRERLDADLEGLR